MMANHRPSLEHVQYIHIMYSVTYYGTFIRKWLKKTRQDDCQYVNDELLFREPQALSTSAQRDTLINYLYIRFCMI